MDKPFRGAFSVSAGEAATTKIFFSVEHRSVLAGGNIGAVSRLVAELAKQW